jgi:hypothetical protein
MILWLVKRILTVELYGRILTIGRIRILIVGQDKDLEYRAAWKRILTSGHFFGPVFNAQ